MIRRIVLAVAALGAVTAAAGVVVVALAFAFYTWLRQYLDAPAAAAVIAGVFAIATIVLALILVASVKRPRRRKPAREQTFAERMAETLRERPLIAALGAAAAGLIAWRNPALVATLLALLEPRDRRERR